MVRRTYAKRYKPRSRNSGGASWRRAGSHAGGFAYQAWKGVKMLKSLINVERKTYDTDPVLNTPTITGPGLDWLTTISEGSDYNQRTGISVKANSLYLRGFLTLGGTVPLPTNLRMVVVLDKEGYGTSPTTTDVFEDATHFNAPLSHINVRRFTILSDKVYSLCPGNNQTLHFKSFMKLNHHVLWSNSTTGTKQGHIYCFYFADNYNATTSFVTTSYHSRFRFIDN